MRKTKKKIVIQNELIQVKGRVQAITVRKEDFNQFLKLTKLKVLDKTYDVLMPPINDMKKNTIDLNGLAIILQNYLAIFLYASGSTSSPTPAQIVFSTSSGSPVTLSYSSKVNPNSQGVMVFPQIFGANGNLTFQFYFIGFDTTDNSYSVTQAELYASAWVNFNTVTSYYTPLVRIAYTNISIAKSSTEYLFIVWLIEFENIPCYTPFAVPIFQNNLGLEPYSMNGTNSSSVIAYFYNGSCNFACKGNCPNNKLQSFVTYIQNNQLVVEFPLSAPIGNGVSSIEVLICTTMNFTTTSNSINILATISSNTSTTVTPPVSGGLFYVAIATISITYTGS